MTPWRVICDWLALALALVVVLLALAWFLSSQAHAGGITAATVTGTSAVALAAPTAGPGWRLLVISNESTSDTVACTFDGTASISTAGSFTLPPRAATGASSNRLILGPFAATIHNAVDCISSGTSTPVTIFAE